MRLVTAICLLCIHNIAVVETSLTIESVTVSGSEPYTPPVADNREYDLPAGATVRLRCEIPGAQAVIRYPTLDIAKYRRFDGGDRVSNSTNSTWTMNNVQSFDTGAIECYNPLLESDYNTIYVYINDDNAPLFVPLNTTISHYYYMTMSYLPCLPTNSHTQMGLMRDGNVIQQMNFNVSGTHGIQLCLRKPMDGNYTCTYKLGDRTDAYSVELIIISEDEMTAPSLGPELGKYHYLKGETLVMQCVVQYEYMESLIWSYPSLDCTDVSCKGSDEVIITTTRNSNNYKEHISTLSLGEVEMVDSGIYSCSYKSFGDDIYRMNMNTTQIYVHAEPFVQCENDDLSVVGMEGDASVSIAVNINAMPKPQLMWYFNSDISDIKDYSKHQPSMKQTSEISYQVDLKILSLSRADSGRYILTSSDNSEVPFYCNTTLQVNVAPSINFFYTYNDKKMLLNEENTVYVKPDRELTLECTVVDGVPRPNISFSYQNSDKMWTTLPQTMVHPQPNVLNQPYISLDTPKSQRVTLCTQNSTRYRCESANAGGAVMSQVHLVVSVLSESSEGVGFTDATIAQAADLVEDDNLLLECYVAKFECADTDVQVVATTGGGTVVYTKESHEPLRRDDVNAHILSIQLSKIEMTMNGDKYVCRCSMHGSQGPSLTLTVKDYEAPRWDQSSFNDKKIDQGSSHSFSCRPKGRPLPAVKWYKDGLPLYPTHTVLLSQDMYNLTILNASADDSGEYKCVGETVKENIHSSFNLSVKEKGIQLSSRQIAIMVSVIVIAALIGAICGAVAVRRNCRKKYLPHELLLPSKETLNPNIAIDEQTDALPYDIGWEFPIGNLKLGMLLGQGAFGRVLKAEAMNIEEGVAKTIVAVKTVRDQQDLNQVKSLISELKILIHIGKHLNVVNLLGACTKDVSKGHLLVIVEYCRYGNLRAYLLLRQSDFQQYGIDLGDSDGFCTKLTGYSGQDDEYLNEGPSDFFQCKRLTPTDIMSWCYQIARGMEYLASIDYIHRDLAARNVLLADDNIVKICDFGLSKDIYKYKEYQKQSQGPLPIKWMALESLTHKVFNVRTDVWSYGVTVWELFSLAATPYPGWDIDDTFIDKLKDGYRMDRPALCPQNIFDEIILPCWDVDPEKRPDFTQIAHMLIPSLEKSVVERLNFLERKYVRKGLLSKKQDDGVDISSCDEVFVGKSSLPPQSANGTKAKYYNILHSDTDGNVLDDELLMPNEIAPSAPRHLSSGSTLECGASSSSAGSSRNARPPSYHFVMDNQDALSDSMSSGGDQQEMHCFSLESIDV